ncbi:MAG: hypothetical protein J7L34_09435 [Thermotogaceae bacterium]|nr:hypothetical protein [Thermotogaceae bacterium]
MSDYIEIRIGCDLISRFFKDTTKVDNITVEPEGKSVNIVITGKLMGMLKIPVSVRLALFKVQESPDDPIIFEIKTNKLVMNMIKGYSSKSFEMKDGKLYVFPFKMFSLLKRFIIFDLNFEDNFVSLFLKPVQYLMSDSTQ